MTTRKRPSETPVVAAPSSTYEKVIRIDVKIKSYRAVAYWSWNANDEVCGICQSPFEGCAPGVKFPGEDCPVVWGKCGHAFHLQCVSKWLGQAAAKNSCPICRQEWEFGSNPVANGGMANDMDEDDGSN